MVLVQDWVDSIRPDVPEPLDSLVARQVRYAIQEFFRLSEAWRHTERLPVKDINVLLQDMPAETYVASTRYAYFEPEGRDGRRKLVSTLPHRIESTNQISEFSHSGNTILLDAAEKGTLEVLVVVQPNRNIDSVPDSLGDKWFDVIRRGAVARLLSMPEQPWTNGRAAAFYENHFREGIELAKRETRRDRSRPKRAVQFNKGFSW